MRSARTRSIIFLAASMAACGARAADGPPSISHMVADLQRLQANIAAGDKAAYAAQKDQLRTIGTAIARAAPDVWRSKRERDVAAVYILSGGLPADVGKLLQSEFMPKEEQTLLRGAIAYVLGHETDAIKFFDGVDPRTLDLRLAGQVAFVLAILNSRTDELKAIAFLDLARLLAPGSLVEEAALRREITLAGGRRDADQVALLARQYIDRYGRSFYADQFLQNVATNMVQLNIIDDPQKFEKLRPVFRAMTPASRMAFFLAVSRAALINSKIAAATATAEAALQEPGANGANEARARFYRAAAMALGGSLDAGAIALRSLDPSKLPVEDKALFAAVSHLAAHLHDSPAISTPAPAVASSASATQGDKASETIRLAQAAIERTALLSQRQVAP